MLWKIAWRNIWRNKRRSLIVLVSIVVGLVAMVLTDTLYLGTIRQMLDNRIGSHIGHIQIHRQGFREDPTVKNFLPDSRKVEQVVSQQPGIQAYSRRVLSFGLVSSATNAAGVTIVGIEPASESRITFIHNHILEGRYLSGQERAILIGKKLAEKLDVQLGDKLVIMVSALDGTIGSDVFRIVGIFQTTSSNFDRAYIYIPLNRAQQLLNLGNQISEIVIRVVDLEKMERIQSQLQSQLGNAYEVLNFKEIIPLLVYYMSLYEEMMMVYYGIIGLAIVFGIINIMLMSIMERIHEIGVLMAIGMSNRRIFAMILLEATQLGFLGTFIGLLLSIGIYIPLAHTGIDLSMFSESLMSFGVGTKIYPILNHTVLLNALLIIPTITILGAIYPARKAIKFEPVAAIRYI
ncbi:MAG: ABC transporter permease [Calditrichaeota bacterium]|nr:ABC transporter permease [Calditrichota bacterium]